jgi:HEAT repeat protein
MTIKTVLRSGVVIAIAMGFISQVCAQDAPLSLDEREAVVRLQSGKASVRRDACERLGKLKSRSAGADLVRTATSDPDSTVRRAAVVALGRVGDRSRIAEMLPVLRDPNVDVRRGAIEGLVNLYIGRDEGFFTRVRSGLSKAVPFWDERNSATVEPYDPVDPQVTTAISGLLKIEADRGNRVAAVRALGALRATSEIDALADAMGADDKLRSDVLDAYVRIGDTSAARYAIPLFESQSDDLAAQAMLTGGRLRAADCVEPLQKVYATGGPKKGVVGTVTSVFSPERRKAALQALALIGDPRSESMFLSELYDKDPDVRQACYDGLARMADPKFLALVTRNGQLEKNSDVRLAQSFALYKMGQPGLFGVLATALRNGSQREQAAEYVLEADNQAHLMPFLRAPDRDAQLVVIEALGRIGDKDAAEALRPIIRGSEPDVALAADRAVRRIEWRIANAPAPQPSELPSGLTPEPE